MFFVLSKILWWFLQPLHLLLGLMLWGLWLQYRGKRFGRRLQLLACLFLLAPAVLPLSFWVLQPLEQRHPAPVLPERVDGVLVLGGGLHLPLSAAHGRPVLGEAGERLSTLVALTRRYPQARWAYSGGSSELGTPTARETHFVRPWLASQGVAAERVIYEAEARNTHENALYSKALLQPRSGETWLLVTSAHHMPRAVAVFAAQGWPVVAMPCDYRAAPHLQWRLRPDVAAEWRAITVGVHEWLGWLVYRLTGRA